MAAIGGGNPLPTTIGGGLSEYEEIYSALVSAVGIPNAGDDDSIDGVWRWSRATGLAAANCISRAVAQMFPDRLTSFIPVYEEILALSTGTVELTDQERREAITQRIVSVISGAGPSLEDQLQAIDSLFSIIDTDRDTSKNTQLGRGFEDWNTASGDACGPAFGGGRYSSLYPNYSWDFVTLIQYDIGSGNITAANKIALEKAKEALYYSLPAWVTWNIFSNAGFVLDQSLLDIGAFGP